MLVNKINIIFSPPFFFILPLKHICIYAFIFHLAICVYCLVVARIKAFSGVTLRSTYSIAWEEKPCLRSHCTKRAGENSEFERGANRFRCKASWIGSIRFFYLTWLHLALLALDRFIQPLKDEGFSSTGHSHCFFNILLLYCFFLKNKNGYTRDYLDSTMVYESLAHESDLPSLFASHWSCCWYVWFY